MEPTEAIDILRGTTSPASVLHPQIAADMGADALAAWEWMETTGSEILRCRPGRCEVWNGIQFISQGPTPLAAVLEAMKKEATDER